MPAEAYKAVAVGEQMVSKGRQGSDAANRVQVRCITPDKGLPMDSTDCSCLVIEKALVHAQVMMAIIRLQHVASEVLITLNTPVHVSERSAVAAAVQPGPKADHRAAGALFRQALASLKIKDYGLFG